MAQYLDKKQEAEKCNPLNTTRIYWCLGLGETAEALCKQATIKHMFKAIFNLAKKPLLPSPPLKEVIEGESDLPPKDQAPPPPPLPPLEPIEPPKLVPMPPFIEELLALAQSTKLDHPSRKIPIMDILYEDPLVPKAGPHVEPLV
jgi:hypothetical protein